MSVAENTLKKTELLVFGASGHAKVVIDLIEKSGTYVVKWVADDNAELKGSSVYGYTVLGGKESLLGNSGWLQNKPVVVAIGSNPVRSNIAEWLCVHGGVLSYALLHPSAQVARGVTVGDGSVVMAGTVINADTRIGRNVIINTGAIVDHDCTIGDGVHVAPGATLCGGIQIGDQCVIGAGAVICPNLRIGKNVIVGAGATVLNDVPDDLTVVGTPAKAIG